MVDMPLNQDKANQFNRAKSKMKIESLCFANFKYSNPIQITCTHFNGLK